MSMLLFIFILILILLVFSLLFTLLFMWRQVYSRQEIRQLKNYVFMVCFSYLLIIVIFAGVYFLLAAFDEQSNLIIGNHVLLGEKQNIRWVLGDLIYFSSMTLFTVGYGDIQPVGIAKYVAVAEAFIGYLLPPIIIANGAVKFANPGRRQH